jgi:hypothetical protein
MLGVWLCGFFILNRIFMRWGRGKKAEKTVALGGFCP